MDIFTTQLTKVRQQPIKPEKLRVKSLKKDANARALNEEKDHLIGETQSPDLHISQYQHDDRMEQANDEGDSDTKSEVDTDKNSTDKSSSCDDDKPATHIDLFI